MRSLKQHLVTIWYANRDTEIVDEWGNVTLGYGDPKKITMSITPVTGGTKAEPFGLDINYDRSITICESNCPIDEYSRVWIDVVPPENHDFMVKRKVVTLNTVRYLLAKVDVKDD